MRTYATVRYSAVSVAVPSPTPIASGYRLTIDRLGVEAPILVNVSGTDEKVYLKAVEDGVAHYKGTPLPGEKGNAFIFGHSSYYQNKPGNYKEVFKRLNELKTGDTLTIHNRDQAMTYQVYASKIVRDDDMSVVADTPDREVVTLMTCWPPGTISKRYVIQAQRI